MAHTILSKRASNLLVGTLAIVLAACGPQTTAPPRSGDTPAAATSAPAAKAVDAKPGGQTAGAEEIARDRSGSGGTLTIAMSAGNLPYPNTPPNEGGEGTRFVGVQLYDGLTNFDLDQGDTVPAIRPGLAESWAVKEDNLTWTFNLRQGVKFHDGTPFDADAVVFQLDRIIRKDFEFHDADMFTLNRNLTLQFEAYRAINPSTVEIKTKVPYSFLPYDLATIFYPSPTVVRSVGNSEYTKHATGTGPYRMTKYVDGQVMELEPFAEYWGGRPKLDKLVLRPMPDPATRLAALQSGEVQWAEVPPPDSVAQLRASGFNVLLKQYPHTILFFLNMYDPPFDNPKVREALQYAVDRDKMCDGLLNGLCAPAHQFAPEGHPWFDPQVAKRYTYDPAKAKQLLAEAGHPNGLSITISYPTGGSGNMWPGPMMELLQANFKAVGVDMKITPLEWNNILSAYRASYASAETRQYNGMYFSVGSLAPVSVMNFLKSRIPPAGCCNAAAYQSDEYERLVGAGVEEFDDAKRDALFRQAMGVQAEDSATIYVVHDLNLRALSPKVRGFIQPQSWFADLKNVWVSK